MNEQQLLSACLMSWAQAEGVSLNWVRGSLRLEMADGTAGTVLSFAPDFWERFQAATQEQRERALASISQDVALLYRGPGSSYAYVIDVPNSCIQELAEAV